MESRKAVSLSRYKVVKDPIYGYVKVYRHELPLVDSIAFQRLRRLKQLSAADLVYPGAVHTRFSHSLGVAHVAEVFVTEILKKLAVRIDDIERYVVLMRLIALLHDIGHGPYSHTFEDYVLIPRGVTHEDMSSKLVESYEPVTSAVEAIVSEYGYSVKQVSRALRATSVDDWPFTSTITEGASERALFYIIKGAFSSDIIDYLLRDSYYTGAGYGSGIDWQRLAHYTYIENDKLVLDSRALEVLDQLLIARLLMFSTVYYHKTVRAATKFVGDILKKIDESRLIDFDNAVSNLDVYLTLDDYSILLNDRVRELPEVRSFLSRYIPYKAIAEHRIVLPDAVRALETLFSMSKSYLENEIVEQMRKSGIELRPEVDFFIDTPKLPLNPMLSDEIIYVRDLTEHIYSRRVIELTWFHIPRSVAVIRLYVHRERVKDYAKLRQVFYQIFEQGVPRSFY